MEGAPITHRYRISSWEAYNRIDLRVTTKPKVTQTHVVSYTLHPRGSKTVVRFTEDYVARGGYIGFVFDRLAYTDDVREGLAAFGERRPPEFKGG